MHIALSRLTRALIDPMVGPEELIELGEILEPMSPWGAVQAYGLARLRGCESEALGTALSRCLVRVGWSEQAAEVAKASRMPQPKN